MKPDSFTYLLSVSELEVARERMKTSRMKKEPIEMLFLLVVVVGSVFLFLAPSLTRLLLLVLLVLIEAVFFPVLEDIRKYIDARAAPSTYPLYFAAVATTLVLVILFGSLVGYCWFRECTGYLSFIYQHSLYIFGGDVILVWIIVLILRKSAD